MKKPLYQILALTLEAIRNCEKSGNGDWEARHMDRLMSLVKDHMPSGSGIDDGTHLDLECTSPERLVLSAWYHHMDKWGGYDGWTEYTVTVKGSLAFGITLKIGGRDRNGIKDYLYDVYHEALTQEVEEYERDPEHQDPQAVAEPTVEMQEPS